MKLQSDPSITGSSTTRAVEPTPATPSGPPLAKSLEALADKGDGIRISIASTALNQLSAQRSAKIGRVTAAVQEGSYQTSSSATSIAIIEHALSGGN